MHLSRVRLVRLGARAREGSTTTSGFPDRSRLGRESRHQDIPTPGEEREARQEGGGEGGEATGVEGQGGEGGQAGDGLHGGGVHGRAQGVGAQVQGLQVTKL